MRLHATRAALAALALLFSGAAWSQAAGSRGDVATVVGLFVEQAPGLYTEERLARGASGPRWAEIRRAGEGVKTATEMVRIPGSVSLRAGDRVLVASRAEPSASAGSGAPSRTALEPYVDRPLDFTAQGLRSPVTRPLAVVPGSCVPF